MAREHPDSTHPVCCLLPGAGVPYISAGSCLLEEGNVGKSCAAALVVESMGSGQFADVIEGC